MQVTIWRRAGFCLAAAAAILSSTPASAELVLSELIIDLQPSKSARRDIEVWNNSPERSFVVIEPRLVENPGLPQQAFRRDPDPEKLGLLVSPQRMILEPGQLKLVRIGSLLGSSNREQVYRVMVKPVVAGLQSDEPGLKIEVGYDVLVMVRPAQPNPQVAGVRNGRELSFQNLGNVSVELVDGRQCADTRNCSALPGKRLYPGAYWTVKLPSDRPAEYSLKSPGKTERKVF